MSFEPSSLDRARHLAALAIGLLVSTGRVWKSRALGEGRRLAGLPLAIAGPPALLALALLALALLALALLALALLALALVALALREESINR